MRRGLARLPVLAAAVWFLASGCWHVTAPDWVDGGDDSGGTDDSGLDAVDMLLVVDNSGSMGEEQHILATVLHGFMSNLVDPPQGADHPALDDLRVAVVSTDMGLQWGGNPFDHPGDGWPYDPPPCGSIGDDGSFQSYPAGQSISLGGDVQLCPDPPGDYASTSTLAPNPDLAFQVSCLSALGTSGCGFEQQLGASRRSLTREDQQGFLRDEALLVVLVVSDEEDCSIEDGPELFATPEIQNVSESKINLVCSAHEDLLYDVSDFHNSLIQAKDGEVDAVVFGAIVGVPVDPACEGTGNQIDGCLDHPDMELVAIQEDLGYWFHRPACTRSEGDDEVTKARPGRRFVELAQDFGGSGLVFSICNEDWSPAMDDLADLIFDRIVQD